jgi:hypothetical protein
MEVASSESVHTQLDMLQNGSSMCTVSDTLKNSLIRFMLIIITAYHKNWYKTVRKIEVISYLKPSCIENKLCHLLGMGELQSVFVNKSGNIHMCFVHWIKLYELSQNMYPSDVKHLPPK